MPSPIVPAVTRKERSREPHAVLHGDLARRLHRRPEPLAGLAVHAGARRRRAAELRRGSSPGSARSRWARRRTSGSSTTSSPASPESEWRWPYEAAVLGLHAPLVDRRPGRSDHVHERGRRRGARGRWPRQRASATSGSWAAATWSGSSPTPGCWTRCIATIAPVTLGAGVLLLPRRIELRLEEAGRNGDFACARYSVVREADG